MDFKLKQTEDELRLVSGRIMNLGFLIPLVMTIIYTVDNPVVTVWRLLLFLLFLIGATYREQWLFTRVKASYSFSLLFLPLIRREAKREELDAITMKVFLRGERTTVDPGSNRKWFQTEQGVLKLRYKDESDYTLLMESNRKNLKAVELGEEIARFLEIPFLLNKE